MARRRARSATSGMLFPIHTAAQAAAVAGMKAAAKKLLTASNELAPKDDRDLIKSGRVYTEDLTVQVAYTAPHAHLQHERIEWQHTDGGQAKFLEAADDLIDAEAEMVRAILAEFGDG